jgi:hypothetical protein
MSTNEITLDDIQCILCIDCWAADGIEDAFYSKIDQYIDFSKIHHIIVANYQSTLRNTDNSLTNTYNLYNWDKGTQDIEIIHSVFVDYTPADTKKQPRHDTSKWLESKLHNDHSYRLLQPHHFIKHVNDMVPNLTNWLVIGGNWKICAHNRPLGFKNLVDMPLNFFIANWSIYDINNDKGRHIELTDEMIETDSECIWEKAGTEIYKLVGLKEE